MSRAVLVLCIFTAFSYAVDYLYSLAFTTYSKETQDFFVRLLEGLGIPRLSAIMTAKNLMLSPAFLEILQMLVIGLCVILPVTVFAKRQGLSGDECFATKGKFINGLVPTMGLCQMTIMFVLFAANHIGSGFVKPMFGALPGMSLFAGGTYGDESIIEKIIIIIGTGIFTPFAEEHIFRGVFLSYLRRHGTSFGIVASALIFGVAHTEPAQAVFAFGFGIMAGFLVVVTGNMKTAILCHALNNIIYLVEGFTYGTDFYVVLLIFKMMLYIVGFAGLYYLLKKGGHMDVFSEKVRQRDGHLSSKPGMKQVFCLPMIAYIILNVVSYLTGVIK